MGATSAEWQEEVAALAGAARVIAYDRRGYGGSPAPEAYEGTSAAEQGEDLAALVEDLGAAPAILCGRDFGALACLHVLLRRPALARGAVLADPPLLSLAPDAIEALTAERVALGKLVHDAGPRAAMEAWLGRETGASPQAFFADYGGLATLEVTRRELRAIAVPVVVVTTPAAPAHVRTAAGALLGSLSHGRAGEGVAAAAEELARAGAA